MERTEVLAQLFGLLHAYDEEDGLFLVCPDKLAFGAARNTLLKVQKEVRQGWGEGISVQLFSAPKRQGIEEAHGVRIAH